MQVMTRPMDNLLIPQAQTLRIITANLFSAHLLCLRLRQRKSSVGDAVQPPSVLQQIAPMLLHDTKEQRAMLSCGPQQKTGIHVGCINSWTEELCHRR